MRYYYWFAVALLCGVVTATGWAQEEWCIMSAENATGADLPRVLLIGDSITSRYSAQASQILKNKAYVSVLTTSRGWAGLCYRMK